MVLNYPCIIIIDDKPDTIPANAGCKDSRVKISLDRRLYTHYHSIFNDLETSLYVVSVNVDIRDNRTY